MQPSTPRRCPVLPRARAPHTPCQTRTLALLVALSIAAGACGASHGWVPALMLGANASRVSASQTSASSQVALGQSERWTLAAELSVAWLPATRDAVGGTRRTRPPPSPPDAPCASRMVCAWERETRARAVVEPSEEEKSP